MINFTEVYASIEGDLARVRVDVERALARAGALMGVGGVPGEGAAGKQLRPAMLILVSRLFSGDAAVARRLAASIELIHAASLIHDDVIDDAPLRRGRPTAGKTMGASDAVLLGDVIFMGVFRDMVALENAAMLDEITRAAAEVCAGEVRQHRAKGRFAMTRGEYLKIVELKTASLYRACAVLGALSGGAAPREVEAAGRFGKSVGMSFQVADDLLDVVGDATRAGKPVRRDLAEGRVTLPAIVYLEGLSARERRAAVERFAARDRAFLRKALAAMAAPEAADAVGRVAGGYCRRARRTLEELPVGIERESLSALCRFAAERKH